MDGLCCDRDMSAEEACELGRRAIYHATFRDAVSGGTVSGALPFLPVVLTPVICHSRCHPTPRQQYIVTMLPRFAVYHVTKNGWKKVSGTDVGELHFEYYPKPVRSDPVAHANGAVLCDR